MKLEFNGLFWAKFNPLTHCYEAPDGTAVAAEHIDSIEFPSDVFHIKSIREQQRQAIEAAHGIKGEA